MNSNIFADNYIHCENDYFNLLSLVYFGVYKYKRFNCLLLSLNLKKRVIYLELEDKYLKDLELNGLHFLKILNCKYNKLTSLSLENIPN